MQESLKGRQQCILDETKTTSFTRPPAWLFLRQKTLMCFLSATDVASFPNHVRNLPEDKRPVRIFKSIKLGTTAHTSSTQSEIIAQNSQIAARESFRRQLAKKRRVNLPSTYILKNPDVIARGNCGERKSRTRQSCKELFAELRASVTCGAEIY